MAGTDKTVKVVFGVDEASASKAKRIISELTAEVKRFVQATQQANFNFGGGVGGSGGANASNIPGRPGTSAGTQMQHTVGGATSGLAANLTKAVTNSAALFKGAAQGSKDSFKVMGDALKQHVNTSDQEIRKLVTSLERLDKQYDKLKSRQLGGKGGALTQAAMGQLQGQYYGELGALDKVRSTRTKLMQAQSGMEMEGDTRGFNGPMGRVRGAFSRAGNFVKEAGSEIGAALGLPSGLLSGKVGLIGAAIAGAAVGAKIAATGRTNEVENVQYGIDKPMFRLNAQAQVGQIYGGTAMAIRHGDIARSMALGQLARDSSMQAIASENMGLKLRLRRDLATPIGMVGHMAAEGFVKGTYNTASSALGSIMGDFIGGNNPGNIGTYGVDLLKRARMTNEQQTLSPQMMQQALEAKMATDPQFNDRWNRLYGGALGELGAARTGGLSGGLVNLLGKRGGPLIADTRLLQGLAESQGYELSDAIGARARMGATVGRRAIGKGTFGLLNMEAGGLSNAAQLRSVGAQFGGGNYNTFMSTMQRGIGRGGLDVLAGSQIGDTVMGAMTSGSFQGEGGGLLRTMLDAAGGTPNDIRGAREAAGGLGALGAVTSGSLDPYQQAMNASAAMRAAPGAAWGTQSALMHADQGTLIEFMKRGVVPPSLASNGVTAPMLEKYSKMVLGGVSLFSRIPDKALGNTPTGQEVRKLRAAGSLNYLGGLAAPEKEAAIGRLANALVHGKVAPDLGKALGMVRALASAQGARVGSTTAAGAQSTISKGSALYKAAETRGILTTVEGEKLGTEDQLGKAGAEGMPYAEATADNERKASLRATASGDPEFAIKHLEEGLRMFVSAIRGIADGRTPRAAGAPHARR